MKASHKDAFPFVILLAPFATGILLRLYNHGFFYFWPLWPILALAVIFVLLNLLYKPLKIFRYTWLGGIAAIIFLLLAGILITGNAIEIDKPDHFSKTKASNLLVTVTTEPVIRNGNLRFTARVTKAVNHNNLLNVSGKLLIALSERTAKNINYGDVLLISANYKPVSPPLNPAEFDYCRYLTHKNIYHQAYLSPGQFIKAKADAGNPLLAYAQRLRKQLVQKFKVAIIHPDAAAVASTLILGYNAEISNDVLQAYSKTGTIHVLSVSGAHVGLIYLVLLFLLAPLNHGAKGRLLITLIIIACIWGYALLTGFSPPVCRAGMMLSFILLGRCFARRISQLNILAVSAFVSLLIDPLLITDVGFQLSYLAVGGLIVVQPLIYQKFNFKNKLADKLWLICSASIAAQLVTLPLSIYYFHQVPVYFLVSNLVILIPSAVIMYGGILYLLIPQGWLPGKWLGLLVEKLILFTNRSLSIIEHAPWSTVDKIWLSYAEFLLILIIAILISYCLYKPRKTVVVALSAGVIILSGIRIWKDHHITHSNELIFFSLRNEPAIGLRNGKRLTLITDINTNSKIYNYSVKPYADSCKADEISIKNLRSNIDTDQLTKNSRLIKFDGVVINVLEAGEQVSINKNHGFIYLNGKVNLSDDMLNNITNNQTVIIAGKSSIFYKETLAGRLNKKHIKYMVCGSNKALTVPSN